MDSTSKINSEILKATAELEEWTTESNPQLANCIANIHRKNLELHYAKHEDYGEFINQWVRLGTLEELREVNSIVDYIVDCLGN